MQVSRRYLKAGTEFIKGTKVAESLTEVSKASKGSAVAASDTLASLFLPF